MRAHALERPGSRGFLVVIEGVDGSGKSTLASALAARLVSLGWKVERTKEPTDGPAGRRIRQLAATGRTQVSAEEEYELFQQDRRDHVATVVRPALAAGAVVVQDRSYFSTVAYQGQRGIDMARILKESEAIAPRPDLLVIVDLPADVAVERLRRTRKSCDDFERLEALAAIRETFRGFPEAWCVDGRLPPDEILEVVFAELRPRLGAGCGLVSQRKAPSGSSGPLGGV